MDTRTLTILDYYRIRDKVAGYAASEEGAALLKSREPSSDVELVRAQKALASEWTAALLDAQPLKLSPWQPVAALFPVFAVEGASLDLEGVAALGQFCNAAISFKKEASAAAPRLSLAQLAQNAEQMPALEEAAKRIYRVIDQSGQLRDLPEIRAIKVGIARIKRDVNALLKKYTSDTSLKEILQSDMPVLRSDRQVLAVKASFKGKIKGIVHEMSQSGQTAFIEPDDIVQKNNELIQEENRLSLEIRRIVRELTAELAAFREDFAAAHALLLALDAAYAAARWGLDSRGVFAEEPHGEKTLALQGARHPLLGAKAVPISLSLLPGVKVLIITGPNTGGKTVALKSVALFAALNQSGFPVPAGEGTVLPVFDSIFADIGDEQSMEQSLSTFSAHMKNIACMAQNATAQSLVLLDELGSGTDPQEGGAISMAVLDYLIEKKAYVLATTHHGILKNYGYTRAECSNASVDFDSDTLSPVYRIIMGVPGESHALEIARRNGLDGAICEKAQGYLQGERADVSALIKSLNEKHAELAELEKRFREEERAVREKRRAVDLKELRLRQKELELREQGYRRLSAFADESRRNLENLVRTIREGEITREKTLAVKDYIANLSGALEAERGELERERENLAGELAAAQELSRQEELESAQSRPLLAPDSEDEKIARMKSELSAYAAEDGGGAEGAVYPEKFGCGVEVVANGRRGTIVRAEKNGRWIVAFGTLKMPVKESEMSLVPQRASAGAASVSVELAKDADDGGIRGATFGTGQSAKAAFELRLLGMRYEEAMKALERQIDLAVMQRLNSFSVVHGKGAGILQQGVHNYLKQCPAVAEFRFALPEEGGTGKTYVVLK